MSPRCPCGSGDTDEECCRRFIDGAPAPTAEALMRSRFSAFALGAADYLLASWHPSTRPDRLDLDTTVRWTRLQIVETVAGGPFDRTGTVEFRAFHRGGELAERSEFVRDGGRWYYLRAVG